LKFSAGFRIYINSHTTFPCKISLSDNMQQTTCHIVRFNSKPMKSTASMPADRRLAEGWERVEPLPDEAGSAFKTPPTGGRQQFFYCVKFAASSFFIYVL